MSEADAANYPQAITTINRVVAHYPKKYNDGYMLYLMRGTIYARWGIRCGEWNMPNDKWSLLGDAINDYNTAVQSGGELAMVYANRAAVFLERGELAHAINDIVRCTQLEPQNPDHYILKAKALSQLGDYDQALNSVEHAVHLAPTADAYFTRGLVNLNLQRLETAAADLSRSITLDQWDPNAYEARAEAYQALNQQDAANADLAYASWLRQSGYGTTV